MKFLIDTADLTEIRPFASSRLLDGVTAELTLIEDGCPVVALPPAVLRSLFNHPLTNKDLAAFLANCLKAPPHGARPSSIGSKIMAGIGTVEALVAQGEVCDDVSLDHRLQQRPLKP